MRLSEQKWRNKKVANMEHFAGQTIYNNIHQSVFVSVIYFCMSIQKYIYHLYIRTEAVNHPDQRNHCKLCAKLKKKKVNIKP